MVLAAAGSADPGAAADVSRQAELLASLRAGPVVPAFVTEAHPVVSDAARALGARTRQPVAVASYLLAPGRFHRRLGEVPAAWVSAPLAAHPAVAAVLAARLRGERPHRR